VRGQQVPHRGCGSVRNDSDIQVVVVAFGLRVGPFKREILRYA
jgi:hypothetical protein